MMAMAMTAINSRMRQMFSVRRPLYIWNQAADHMRYPNHCRGRKRSAKRMRKRRKRRTYRVEETGDEGEHVAEEGNRLSDDETVERRG